ncbi:GNAT family N-acetyltransferase [Mucilaginibacter segetis]|uniref:N-acetyltransferase n=1 Tax=Mucilaginibacter segetis TaxID=2793071 RepID=A0A934PSD6_9SPHI|nr:GNAT family N-acetyltransferase [Mucilaginibacter segetis]MBK0378752.1 N-acetyltransferase [Mucilaginibacter segetis]
MKYTDIELINNTVIHNFELFVEGYRAFIDYKQKDDKLYLIHTEVPAELQGKGVAEAMVEKALIYLEANHYKLVPLCSYVQVYLQRHPEWNRLLA